MSSDETNNILDELDRLLTPVKTAWFIIGTASLMLAGFKVEPNDIDILTDSATALQINSLLKKYEQPVQLKDEGKFRSAFSRYVIDDVSIEVMGDLEVNSVNKWIAVLPMIKNQQRVLLTNGFVIIPSTADQIKIYTLFGRPKDETVLKLLNAI